METKILKAVFGGGTSTVTNKRTRTDYGQVLEVIGIDLPDTFECIFSNSNTSAGVGKKMIGSAQRVLIPDEYLATGQTIYAWILLHDTEDDGRHMYSIRIPVADMPDTSPEEPTPVEQSVISQAITALNSAVDTTTQKAQEATESADRAEHAAEGVEGYAERAEAAQSAAESARDRATQAETSARTSAATASEKASEAISSATTASQSALTAETASESARASATASAESASQASQSADTASAKATEASGYASNANTSAQTASQKASEAAQSASTAVQAKTDAETAKQASETAQGLAESARDGAVSAKTGAESARDEAQEIVDGITGKIEQIDSNTERIESLEDDRYKPYPTDTVSGSVASFTDGADNIPLKSCIVRVEPVQDLHGYDSPWPAGGGKNLTSYTTPFVGTVDINTQPTLFRATLTGGKTYTFSCKQSVTIPTSTRNTIAVRPVGNTISYESTVTNFNPTNLRHTKTFTVESTGEYEFIIWSHTPSVSATYTEWQVEEGSSFTSFAPYSNICPITGWTGCEVQRTGKNLLDIAEWMRRNNYDKFTVDSDGWITLPNLSESKVYYQPYQFERLITGSVAILIDPDRTTATNVRVRVYRDETFLSEDTSYLDNRQFNAVGLNYTKAGQLTFKLMANLGATHVDWEPYVGNTYPITFPAEAGTVYGGYIDPINGELVVDRASEEFLFVNPDTNNGFDSKIFTLANTSTPTTSKDGKITNVVNEYVYAGASYGKPHFYLGRTGFIIYLKENTYRGEAIQVCYPLAEPIHYPLTAIDIKTLLGTNNIWSNTGDTEIEYRADTTLYINKKIAEAVSALS